MAIATWNLLCMRVVPKKAFDAGALRALLIQTEADTRRIHALLDSASAAIESARGQLGAPISEPSTTESAAVPPPVATPAHGSPREGETS